MMDKPFAKKFLFDVADIIERFNLPFFLADGTCLGAYRNKDFIDWDTDIDLKMKAEDLVPNCRLLCQAFEQGDFDKVEVDMLERILHIPHCIALYRGSMHLHLGALFLISDGHRQMDGHRWNLGSRPSHAYPCAYFDQPERIEFLGRKFQVPIPMEDYLERVYGPNYMTPMKKDFQPPSHLLGYVDMKITMKAMEAQ